MIGFQPGIEIDELARLLDLLRANLSLPHYEEETLESLLWQAELGNVSFRAISELMQAEAESGRAVDEDSLRLMARSMVELDADDLKPGRRFAAKLSPDDVRGGDVVDQWHLDERMDIEAVSDEEWAERFATEAGDDADAVAAIRNGVRFERSSQLIARLVRILVRSALAGRAELPLTKADELVVAAVRQLYLLGDPVGVLEVVEDTHSLSVDVRAERPDVSDWLRDVLRRVYNPTRAGRLLRTLDPDEENERPILERFLRILPDQAVIAFFEAATREEDVPHRARLLAFAINTLADRVAGWLQNAARMPTDQALPLAAALREADVPATRPVRKEFLRHVSAVVRETSLAWYLTDLPDADVPLVSACLVDRASSVRAAASRVLAARRPPQALVLVERTLRSEGFATLDEDRKTDLCRAFGRLAGPAGLPLLSELLQTRIGLFGDEDAAATVTAAAHGIAAIGTPNALALLERTARSLSGPRRAACNEALATTSAGTTEDANG